MIKLITMAGYLNIWDTCTFVHCLSTNMSRSVHNIIKQLITKQSYNHLAVKWSIQTIAQLLTGTSQSLYIIPFCRWLPICYRVQCMLLAVAPLICRTTSQQLWVGPSVAANWQNQQQLIHTISLLWLLLCGIACPRRSHIPGLAQMMRNWTIQKGFYVQVIRMYCIKFFTN